jgi:hypothetical protein
LFHVLVEPFSSKELSIKYHRSQDRISELLTDLKKEGKIINYRVFSNSYWIRKDRCAIIISTCKEDYLRLLNSYKLSTTEIAKYFNVNYKSSFRRLRELEKLNLVQRDKDKRWFKIENSKNVIVI